MQEVDAAARPKRLGPLAWATFILVLLFATWNSIITALILPMGAGPDEHTHLDHIIFLATEHRLPKMESDRVGQIQHPPLPYAIDALFFHGFQKFAPQPTDGSNLVDHPGDFLGRRTVFNPNASFDNLGRVPKGPKSAHRKIMNKTQHWSFYGLRGISVLLGIGTAFFLLSCLRTVFPNSGNLVVAACCALLLLPSWSMHFAVISNDPWMTFFGAWLCAFALKKRRENRLLSTQSLIRLGLLLALCLLTKLHVVGVLVFVSLLIVQAKQEAPRLSQRLLALGKLAAAPIFLGGWWHLRQILANGGFLALDYHAQHEPFLLRLQGQHWVDLLVIPYQLAESFIGVVTAANLSAPQIFFLPSLALATLSLMAFLLVRQKERLGHKQQPNDGLPVPSGSAILALLTLLGAILIANQHYHHIHGRYFFAALIPLMIVLIDGIKKLTNSRAQLLFTTVALANFAFAVFTLYITVFHYYSISIDKVNRGHVVAYFDCGHSQFDDRLAGGSTFLRAHPSLYDPLDSQRLSVDDKMAYRIKLPDAQKKYQVRLSYPAPLGEGRGEVPRPTGISLYADEILVHGPLSLWPTMGQQVHPLPLEATKDGEVTLTWKNTAPGAVGVSVSEIWIEESWISLEDLHLERRGQTVVFILGNLDQKAGHQVAIHVKAKGKSLAEDKVWLATLTRSERKSFRFDLDKAYEPKEIEVILVATDRSDFVNVKLGYYGIGLSQKSGSPRSPGLVTLRVPPGQPANSPVAQVIFPDCPALYFNVHCGLLSTGNPFESGQLVMKSPSDLGSFDQQAKKLKNGVFLASTTMATHGEPFQLDIRIGENLKTEIEIDRLMISPNVVDPRWGQNYRIQAP